MNFIPFILGSYLAITLMVGKKWFFLLQRDRTTPTTDLISWIVLLGAAVFWPITLPVSSLERKCSSFVTPGHFDDFPPSQPTTDRGFTRVSQKRDTPDFSL